MYKRQARGHVSAIDFTNGTTGVEAFNLGTGVGVSVLELIYAFERATGQSIGYRITPRRPGDVAVSLADPSRAKKLLDWETRLDLAQMCIDSWRFRTRNHTFSEN